MPTTFLLLLSCTQDIFDTAAEEDGWLGGSPETPIIVDFTESEVEDTGVVKENNLTEIIEENCYVQMGTKLCDFTLTNQMGTDITLSDYSGSYILLDFSAMWCGPCQSAAAAAQDLQNNYSDKNVKYIIVLLEDYYSQELDLKDLNDWSDTFGLTTINTLGGSRALLQSSGGPYPLSSWPTFYYINKEGIVEYYHSGYSEEALQHNLDYLTSQ